MDAAELRLSFDQLAALEPRLAELRRLVEASGRESRRFDGGFCANAVWYGYSRNGGRYGEGALRSEVVALVGRLSEHPDPRLHSSDAYDVAYLMLWDLLPPCDHGDQPCGWGASE